MAGLWAAGKVVRCVVDVFVWVAGMGAVVVTRCGPACAGDDDCGPALRRSLWFARSVSAPCFVFVYVCCVDSAAFCGRRMTGR